MALAMSIDKPDGGANLIYGRVAALVVAPAVLAIALVAHPFISGRLPNETAIATEVAADTTMWAVVHIAASVGSGLVVIAFLAVWNYLQEAGQNRLSSLAVPLVVMGGTLYAVLPGMEFAPLAAAETGASTEGVAAAQNAIENWFTFIAVAGGIAFAAGVLLFAAAIWTAQIASQTLTRVVVVALVIMAITRLIPFSVAQFYVHAAAALAAMWTLAYLVWTQPVPSTQT